VHESGCRTVPSEHCAGGEIKLEPWARIEGHLRIGRLPGAGQTLGIQAVTAPGELRIPFSCLNARADAQGRFTFPRVPPGAYNLFRIFKPDGSDTKRFGMSHCVTIEVGPVETARVQVGGHGRSVVGSIRVVPEEAATDWSADMPRLVARSPESSLPGLQDSRSRAEATSMSEAQSSYYRCAAGNDRDDTRSSKFEKR
jgi:hypothetical protein